MAAEHRDDIVLFAMIDTHESDFLHTMGEMNSHRLEESLQRFEGHYNGEMQLSPEESRRALFQVSVNLETGHEQSVLMLASRGQSE